VLQEATFAFEQASLGPGWPYLKCRSWNLKAVAPFDALCLAFDAGQISSWLPNGLCQCLSRTWCSADL
jgi:hypothetical protein